MLAENHKHTARYFDRGRRIGLEIAKENLLKNYDDSIRVIDKLRYAGNDHKVKISDKKHRAMIAFAKSQLGEKLKRILSAEKSHQNKSS